MPAFLFVGGGTGGHIYPSLAVIEQIQQFSPGAIVRIVCSQRPIDHRILSRTGVPFTTIPAKPVSLRPTGIIRFLQGWGPSVRQCRELIRAMGGASEVVVVAMGGFVAAPALQAARAERARIILVNLDAVPGKANRWIARRASRILDAGGAQMPSTSAGVAWEEIAPIVRASARAALATADARSALGFDPSQPVLLVTGGSQGAGSINSFMSEFAVQHTAALAGWQVLHQCGEAGEAELQSSYDRAGIPARVSAFIPDMATAWAAAELMLGRSGAGTVAEVWANRVPALFLPYPYHRDQHQRRNTRRLVEAACAIVVDDHVDTRLNMAGAGEILTRLLRSESDRAKMRGGFHKLGPANGSEAVARVLLGLLDA